jgi:phosphopantothenoylcysteine decarboxylase/phosphopantothenate--cysteine ligase
MIPMQGKTLVLGVTGGIAVYKVPELISRLRKKGLTIEVMMTRAAAEFVTPLTFQEVSRNPVHMEMFDPVTQWNVEHISLAQKADLMAIIPATANIIGKIAGGIADDLVSTTIMAARCPKLIAPAMNTGMYENVFFQRNLAMLREQNYRIVGPDSGELLCGDQGPGRLASLEELEIMIEKALTPQDLAGETVLITAGGTREPIDPVRYIGNHSSGKMGFALARASFLRGAEVFLVSAAPNPPAVKGIHTYLVETTAQMGDKVLALADGASIIIKAAAPADFHPAVFSPEKIKKCGNGLQIDLEFNRDILWELGQKKRTGQVLVGFAAETGQLQKNALEKLERKNLDMIIGNLVNVPGIGMGSDRNRVTIYSKEAAIELPEQPKTELAEEILDHILHFKRKRVSNEG